MGKYVATAVLIVSVGIVVFSSDGSVADETLPDEEMDAGMILDTISHRERVEIEDHLIAGRWTVLEFTADW